MPGTCTSAAEITNISRHGLWVLVDDEELFLAFDEFPWFRRASVESILKVERPHPDHLYWPDLDVDLALGSIKDPGRYPLQAKVVS